MIKKLITIIILLSSPICGCYAQKKIIENATAFYSITMPGILRSDENGNVIKPTPSFIRFIYLESKCAERPVIDSVFYNNVYFTANVDDKKDTVAIAGTRFNDAKPIKLIAKKGNCLWKINLTQVGNQDISNNLVSKIVVIGKLKNIQFVQKIKKEIQILGLEVY